ncbi:MAG: cell surface protein SprA [bacterium]
MHGYLQGNYSKFFTPVKKEVVIESLDSFVEIRQTVLQENILAPVALTLGQYEEVMRTEKMRSFWREQMIAHLGETDSGRSGSGGISLDIPVRIKSKTFQKIFGGDKVGLTVSGDINIQASLRNEDRSEVRTVITRGANTTFKMQQKQRFSVTGKIGDKVTVNVDQDSERAFDFENNVRINYQGYDDEILQRFEAGNIALSLPGTRYVTFSGKNSGLFGLKSQLQLGNLNVTTIASQEKGESQRISLSGGTEEGARIKKDWQYMKNRYFFLDFQYREEYKNLDSEGNHFSSSNPVINVEVYEAQAGNETDSESFRAWATLNADADTSAIPGSADVGFFKRLERNEYYLEPSLGFIRLNNEISNEKILAVTYTTANGTVVGDTLSNGTILLKLIKPRSPRPTDATWDLEWKHVYSLDGRNIEEEGFDVKIFFVPPSGPVEEIDKATGKKWIEVFGLDNKDRDGNPNSPDGTIDIDPTVVDLIFGELHFPDLRPFAPEGYTLGGVDKNLLPPDKRTSAIYDTTVQTVITAQSKFQIEIRSKNRRTEFNLGFNIIEGSEVIILDGDELEPNRDYRIDYFTGTLTILDERASNPASQLDISYERNQLFQLEKKTILGMRAEYDLGGNSFLGGTFLYLSESTLDRKVRVGRGPIRNVVWDVNTHVNFNPNFIGKAFDALPLLRAKGGTALNFEGEIAQILPTPNTLNSSATGDNHGVAYIDDFEGAKKTVNLGVLRKNWTRASPPADALHTPANMVNYIWFNPFLQVFIKDIYPNRDIQGNTNVQDRVHVLSFELFPDKNKPDGNSWGGIMRALSPGLFDQSQTKFIEIMVRGDQGRFHIDLGSISEDVIANGQLDTEDKGVIRDRILDDDEDVGLDGVAKPDPPTLNFSRKIVNADSSADAVLYDFWDLNSDGIKNADEPWSYDDWFYTDTEPLQYFREADKGGWNSIIGTENSRNDEGGPRPDTEDINNNGILDRTNSYFRYSFSLKKDHPDTTLIVGGNPSKGWHLYRIPFETNGDSVRVGQPLSTQIEYVRIWVDGVEDFDQSIRFSIADISLVGSDWKEIGSTDDEFGPLSGLKDTTVAVTQINTHEDEEYLQSLSQIGVQGEEDRVTGITAREQSLVLKATNLAPANSGTRRNIGLAQKSLFQSENYIHYDRIKMFVYGKEEIDDDTHIPNDTSRTSSLEYFLRFGADVNNFYEYRAPVYEEWAPGANEMNILLQEFTKLASLDSLFDDSTQTFVRNLGSGRSIRVKGTPSLTNIRTLVLGIKNLHPTQPFHGEVWFNELRLSDVEQDQGMAMRVRTNMKIGNFATINAELERKDADFHNVVQRFGSGNNSFSYNVNANVNMENFLPQSWGLSIPVSVNVRSTSSTPKYFPGKDRLVTNDLPDSTLGLVRTIRSQNGFNVSFRRSAKSNNFFLKNTLDKLSFKIGRSESNLESPTKDFSTITSWTGNLDYRIDFGRNNSISPFSWLPNLPLINKVKDTKFYYTPQNVSFQINGSRKNENSLDRGQADSLTVNTEDFFVDRSVRATMKIFENLSVDYSRKQKADMRGRSLTELFSGNVREVNIIQNFNTRYSPKIFGWLKNTFTYRADYRFNVNQQQRTTGRSASINTNLSADLNLQWQQLAKSVFGAGKKKSTPRRGTRGRPGERRRPGKPDPKNNKMEALQEKDDDGGGISFNPLRLFGGFFSKFKDLSINYTQRKNATQFGLEEGFPSLAFQFGLSDTTNLGSVANLNTNTLTLADNKTYRIGSGIAFGRMFDVGLTFQHSDQINISTQTSGTTSDSHLKYKGFDMPFPEWTVRISGLEKLPLFTKLFKTVSFNHSFSGQKDITWNETPDNSTQESITTNFRPLGKLDLTFVNGVTGNIQMNRSITLARSLATGAGARRTTRSDLSVTANYSKQSGFKLPFWPFNKKELKNSIDFSVTFTSNNVIIEQSRIQEEDGTDQFEEQDRTTRWSFTPRLSYSFSNQMRGGAFVEIGKTNSKRTGKTSVKEFGINVNISIRGN